MSKSKTILSLIIVWTAIVALFSLAERWQGADGLGVTTHEVHSVSPVGFVGSRPIFSTTIRTKPLVVMALIILPVAFFIAIIVAFEGVIWLTRSVSSSPIGPSRIPSTARSNHVWRLIFGESDWGLASAVVGKRRKQWRRLLAIAMVSSVCVLFASSAQAGALSAIIEHFRAAHLSHIYQNMISRFAQSKCLRM